MEHQENMDCLEQRFDRAAKHFTSLVDSLPSVDLLYCYARYKQGTVGDCDTSKPGIFNMSGKRKWDAWNGLRGMSKKDAMLEYIRGVEERDPDGWDSCNDTGSSAATAGWVRVSRLPLPPPENTANGSISSEGGVNTTTTVEGSKFLDAVRDGCLETLSGLDLNHCNGLRFDNDMTGLHWAVDRGNIEVAELLLRNGAHVDAQDDIGQTALHFSTSCGYPDMVKLLLSSGADAAILDQDGLTAKQIATDQEIALLLK